MAQLGRIGGHLLQSVLTREDVNLSFKNTTYDSTPILFLDVENNRVGVKTDTPAYDLDINSNVNTTNGSVTGTARIDNITVDAATATFSTIIGPINITPTNSAIINFEKLSTDDLSFTDNIISSNETNTNIAVEAAGTGTIEISSSVTVNGNMAVTGNVTMDGNLSKAGDIILGDAIYNPDVPGGDTVEFNPDFSQHILPGDTDTYDFGDGTVVDSTVRRWREMHTPDLTNVTTNRPNAVKVSNQLWLDGTVNTISQLQSNDDTILSPDTGITIVDSEIQIQNNDITNLVNDPVRLRSTGIGYTRFMGDNAMKIPAGDDSSRPSVPEIGDTRWNTDSERLECFAGEIETVTITQFVSGSLVDQIVNSGPTTTSGSGTGATFRCTLVGGSLTISIIDEGIGYIDGDTIDIPGTIFLGGSIANSIELTVGSQTDAGYRVATGGGAEVTQELMDDLGVIYSLILA